MKRILVTGADGALGRALLCHLTHDVQCEVVTAGRRGAQYLDIREAPDFRGLLDKVRPDWVLHLAASFSNDFEEAYAVNVEATHRLLEAASSCKKPPRVLLVGSAAEYGVVQAAENPIREDHVLNPVSVYGLSKAWQTQLAVLYAGRGVDVVVARLFNLAGPGMSERLFVGRVQQQIREVQEGLRTDIELGPLTAIRDYVQADDAAQQIFAIAAHGERGRIYHVASGTPVRVRELLDTMLAANGLGHVAVREAAALSNRAGYDVPAIYADIASTRQLVLQRIQSAAV
jgi:nucleoside-diphosphate-sugar epimerase